MSAPAELVSLSFDTPPDAFSKFSVPEIVKVGELSLMVIVLGSYKRLEIRGPEEPGSVPSFLLQLVTNIEQYAMKMIFTRLFIKTSFESSTKFSCKE